MKLRTYKTGDGEGVLFFCPGCGHGHAVKVSGAGAWQFNGDHERPTFTPSVRCFTNYDDNGRLPDGQQRTLCHSFVRDGRIEFLGDCAHGLAGQTVDLPDWPWG